MKINRQTIIESLYFPSANNPQFEIINKTEKIIKYENKHKSIKRGCRTKV